LLWLHPLNNLEPPGISERFTHGLADFRIIEFRASQRANDMPKRLK
jgi:hypothetical protein